MLGTKLKHIQVDNKFVSLEECWKNIKVTSWGHCEDVKGTKKMNVMGTIPNNEPLGCKSNCVLPPIFSLHIYSMRVSQAQNRFHQVGLNSSSCLKIHYRGILVGLSNCINIQFVVDKVFWFFICSMCIIKAYQPLVFLVKKCFICAS